MRTPYKFRRFFCQPGATVQGIGYHERREVCWIEALSDSGAQGLKYVSARLDKYAD